MGKSRLLQLASEGLELPPDLLQGAVRVDLLGRAQLRVVNHRGIIMYTPQQISLRLEEDRLSLYGRSLQIVFMDEEQILIEGQIDGMQFGESGDEV